MPLSPNFILHQRYQIHALLGQGGFGAVYRALDLNLNRWCAVKENLLDPTLTPAQQQAQQQQFQREALLLSRLRHPHLPLIYDYFIEPNGQQYLVMEFVEGTDLHTLVQQRGALPEAQVLQWVNQILDALEYLHTQNPPIIHRDIKPQNLLITPQGKAMLVDFGIAKVYIPGQPTTMGARAVSPGYSPPEQYGQGTTDARSDIYALGATLYFALTAVEPPESVQRVVGVSLTLPRALHSHIAAQTESVILRAMEIHPQKRFASAVEMKRALGTPTTVPASPPVSQTQPAPPPPLPPPPPPKKSRRPVLAGIVSIVGLVASLILLAFLYQNQPLLFTGHTDVVWSVAFAPDGRTLASGSWDNTIKLWDVSSGREVRTLRGHTARVWSVAFAPDGRTLASGSDDNTIKLWDVSSGREVRTLSGHTHWVYSVAFAPDGRTLASGSGDQTIKLWDVSSGREVRTLRGHAGNVWSVAFAPDGRTLASGSGDQTIKLWDVSSGREVRTLRGHTAGVYSVAFAPDGRTLASGSGDQTIKLWDVSSGREVRTLSGHTHWVYSVAFAPDGRTLASGSYDHTIKLWDVSSGREVRTLRVHTGEVDSLAFSPDGRTLASGSYDHTIKLWDVSSGQLIWSLERRLW